MTKLRAQIFEDSPRIALSATLAKDSGRQGQPQLCYFLGQHCTIGEVSHCTDRTKAARVNRLWRYPPWFFSLLVMPCDP